MNRQFSFGRNKGSGAGSRQWVHTAETLTTGRVVYNVKFLGHVEVDQPKGSEMVRDAIRKMKFNKQIKKAEGHKPQKVELVISVDAIAVVEPKLKVVQYQYPLHLVSYCADDKSDKKMFTFIAKEKDSDRHHCFVFDSDKCAEEITLTLGQAFDLAYRRFLDSQYKNVDTKKQTLLLQQKVEELTAENTQLKERVALLEKLLDIKKEDGQLFSKMEMPANNKGLPSANETQVVLLNDGSRTLSPGATNGSSQPYVPALAPPPAVPSRSYVPHLSAAQLPSSTADVDLFGAKPFTVTTLQSPPAAARGGGGDVFGMPVFSPVSANSTFDQEMIDMQAHFSRGLSIGTEDFSLDDFDPCKK